MERLWELRVVEWLQGFSNAPLDYFVGAITFLGDETIFFTIFCALLWCVDKRMGYRFSFSFLLGSGITGALKGTFKLPRPYEHPSGRAVSIFSKTGGYTFPSGHSQNIANICTQGCMIGFENRQRLGKVRLRIILICGVSATLLVMFSRVYLGQHYPLDTLAGMAVGVVSAIVAVSLFEKVKGRGEDILALSLAAFAVVLFILIPEKTLSNASGVFAAASIGYVLEKRLVRHDVQAALWLHGCKLAFGILIALALKEGLKMLFGFSDNLFWEFVRYFCIGLWATLGAPFAFQSFKKFLASRAKKKGENSQIEPQQ